MPSGILISLLFCFPSDFQPTHARAGICDMSNVSNEAHQLTTHPRCCRTIIFLFAGLEIYRIIYQNSKILKAMIPSEIQKYILTLFHDRNVSLFDYQPYPSREDVFHSIRNERLLQSVAETFRDAVLHFCSRPKLQYQWMRYLPSDSISDDFWKMLRPKIIYLLTKTSCIRSWRGAFLHLPNQLYFLDDKYKDGHGEPPHF